MRHDDVTDWTNDFDHRHPEWIARPAPIWDHMRKACPVATTSRYGGVYLPTGYTDICEIANDPEHFSSRSVVVREDASLGFGNAPINSDPPEHTEERRLLLQAFSADTVRKLEPSTRAICRDLIKPLLEADRADAARDYAQHIPARIMALLLGLPNSDGDLFRKWIYQSLDLGIVDADVAKQSLDEMTHYMGRLLKARRARPEDDIPTMLLAARIADQPLSDDKIVGMLRLLLIAGIDTTWSLIASSLLHLARTPQDRNALARQPEHVAPAVEEFLRAFSPVTMAREIIKECRRADTTFERGRMVLLSFPAANRDPSVFENPSVVSINRDARRHVAFGYGRHRCLGAGLARMETKVALEEWLAAFPGFAPRDGEPISFSEGIVRGPRTVPVWLSAHVPTD
jgi:cytochrome P450